MYDLVIRGKKKWVACVLVVPPDLVFWRMKREQLAESSRVERQLLQ
jgi:hypothetical protein